MHGSRPARDGSGIARRGACLRCPPPSVVAFRTVSAMHERCTICGLRFEREQGYFLGVMYIN